MAPTHDAYLDNGTDIGLTVGRFIIACSIIAVNFCGNSDSVTLPEDSNGQTPYRFYPLAQQTPAIVQSTLLLKCRLTLHETYSDFFQFIDSIFQKFPR